MSRTIKYVKFTSERRFGVELEVNNTVPKHKIKAVIRSVSDIPIEVSYYGNDVDNNYWHIKEDSSCGPLGLDGPRGFEIASYVGKGIADIQHIAHTADTLRQKRVEVTDYCGLHIHADVHDLTYQQVGTIIAYWLKIEYVMGMSLPERRRSNEFCRYMHQRCNWSVNRKAKYTSKQIWDMFKPEDLSANDNPARRVTLNLVNYARCLWYPWLTRKTLELRWPEGTLDGRDVKNWLRLFLHFIENVKDREMPDNTDIADLEDVLTILGLHHEGCDSIPPGPFYLLSEGLLDTKTWLLERMLRYLKEANRYGAAQAARNYNKARMILNRTWSPLKKYAPR